jgi:hypothetical protein
MEVLVTIDLTLDGSPTRSLVKDVGEAVSKLDAVVSTVAFIIVAFIWLLLFNPCVTRCPGSCLTYP